MSKNQIEEMANIIKAEIERLKAESAMADGYADALEERAKAEAIKEFADKVIDLIYEADDINSVSEWQIRNLVKEMTE